MNAKIAKILVVVFVLLGIGFAAFGNPFKVTDPADPRFNPDQFSFSDYKTREEMIDAFRKLFPVGTPKEFVDRVLVKAGGAKAGITSPTFPKLWQYREPYRFAYPFIYPGTPQHQFIFENNHIVNVEVYATEVLYPDQLTHKDLIKEYESNLKKQQGEAP